MAILFDSLFREAVRVVYRVFVNVFRILQEFIDVLLAID